MTILFITNNLPPVVDGVGDYTYNIARQFAMHRHKVYIVCRDNAEVNTHVEGMTIVPCVKAWGWSCYKPIVQLIREKGIEVVSLQYVPHGFHPKGLPFAMISVMKQIKAKGVKVMVFCHEISISYVEKKTLKRYLIYSAMRYTIKKILQQTDAVATSIDYYYNILRQLAPNTKCCPPVPIVANIPRSHKTKEELRLLKNRIAARNEVIVSFFGKRNVKNSIIAINHLIKEGLEIKVLFIGNSSQEETYGLNRMNYYQTGIIELQDIDQYLQVSDILILPESNLSGCSFKSGALSAAFRDGVAVLSSIGFLTSKKLVDGYNILNTNFDAVSDIENRLRQLIENPSLRIEIGKHAQFTVQSHTWENTYSAYMSLLSEI